jgi:hypothetical protein
MYLLVDTFNNSVLSRHRSIKTVAKAECAHRRWWKRNGGNSYIPTAIVREDGEDLTEAECEAWREAQS